MIKKIIISALMLFCSLLTFSQNSGLYSFNELYGFDTKAVYDIHQDKKGHVWIGCEDGLFRFDGTNFKVFYHPSFDKEATNLQEDKDGRIWYCNFAGQIFYIENDSCKLFENFSKDLKSFIVFRIDRFPQIDVMTANRVQTKNFYTKKKKDLKVSGTRNTRSKIAQFFFLDIIVLQGELYCIYQNKMNEDGTFTHEIAKCQGEEFSVIHNSITINFNASSRFVKARDRLYVVVHNTKQRLLYEITKDLAVLKLKTNSSAGSAPIYYKAIDKNRIFVAEKDVALYYNIHHGIAEKLPKLSGLQISKSITDLEGNQWYATINSGIYIRPKKNFSTYKYTDDKHLLSVFNPNGTAYVLTDKQDFISINPRLKKREIKNVISIIPSAMVYDPYHNLAFFSVSQQAITMDKEGNAGKTRRILNSGTIKKAVFLDKEHYLHTTGYASMVGRVNYGPTANIKLDEELAKKYGITKRTEPRPFSILRLKRCVEITFDIATTDVYIDYVDGLYCHGNYSNLEMKNNDRSIICEQLLADKTNGIWLVDNQKNLFRIINRKMVLQSDIPISVKLMTQWKNYLFLANEDRIIKYDTLTKKAVKFNFSDDMFSENIENITVVNDTLRVLTETQITDVPCQYNFTNEVPPRIFINQIKVYDDTLELQPSYTLSQSDNNIEINFSAISIRSQKQYIYQYRMLGISDKWITNSSAVPFARFPKLESGNYTFELRACNEDGVCSEVEKIKFVIKPYFYKTWWFILLGILFFGVLAFMATRYWFKKRANQQLLEQEKEVLEKEVFKSKIAAIRSQMNPHFMFNALNTIQEFIMTNQKNVASEYLADFADLMRKYLNQSKEDSVSLEEEIETLSLYLKLEKLRFEENFEYNIEVDVNMDEGRVYVPVMLLQPFVENAIKHGLLHKKGEKKLSVSFVQKDNNLIVTIEDNGVGRKRSQEINENRTGHDSFATSAIEERIRIYNHSRVDEKVSVHIEDLADAQGTKVVLIIPV